jgi:hypothetical protein
VVTRVELDELEAWVLASPREERRNACEVAVGDDDFGDGGLLEEIVCTGGTLKAAAKDEETHGNGGRWEVGDARREVRGGR